MLRYLLKSIPVEARSFKAVGTSINSDSKHDDLILLFCWRRGHQVIRMTRWPIVGVVPSSLLFVVMVGLFLVVRD
jgi:hypothetical protein